MLTLDNLIDDGAGTLLADIVNDNICAQSSVHVCVCTTKTGTGTGDNYSLAIKTYFG
jgi:hypothetical protein